MFEYLTRIELGELKLPRLYVDHVSGKTNDSLAAPAFLGADSEKVAGPASKADRESLWNDVLSYNARLGASDSSLAGIEALARGKAVPVVTGQQPGLFGGPLYTLYKVLTAVALSERLSAEGKTRVVPILWNAADDSDFEEVSTASFFDGELSRKTFSVSSAYHSQGRMVGSIPTEAVEEPFNALARMLGETSDENPAARFVGEAFSVARDMGEAFSALFLRLASSSGVAVVDARLPSVSGCSKEVIDAYLKSAPSVEREATASLRALRDLGYDEPVSEHSAEVCVFLKDGETRKRISPDELSNVRQLWEKGGVELVPNVLLGPIVRNEILGAVANVLGPSEIAYTFVTSAICKVLGFDQVPIFPRLSMTLVPRDLMVLIDSDAGRLGELIRAFDETANDYFRRNVPADVEGPLTQLTAEIRSALERATEQAVLSGRSTQDITASARRKIEFELQRITDAFHSVHRKKALAEKPMLRQGRELLSPRGTLQERVFCSLAPLVYSGESFLSGAQELAHVHVRECLEGRAHHYGIVADIP
jgi:bacillithiol biosynthesis cysteine-adding enzyme BshC